MLKNGTKLIVLILTVGIIMSACGSKHGYDNGLFKFDYESAMWTSDLEFERTGATGKSEAISIVAFELNTDAVTKPSFKIEAYNGSIDTAEAIKLYSENIKSAENTANITSNNNEDGSRAELTYIIAVGGGESDAGDVAVGAISISNETHYLFIEYAYDINQTSREDVEELLGAVQTIEFV
jgi:hypothetical protein